MRVQYNSSNSTAQAYHQGLNSDLGVYHVQMGAGIGSFLGRLLKKVIPIGKSLLHHGYEAMKPELKKVAKRGIDNLVDYGTRKLAPAKRRKRNEDSEEEDALTH